MPVNPWLRSLRLPLAAGLAAANVVAAAVFGYVATRPVQYESRFTLVATPAGHARAGDVDLGTLVNIQLPSLTELARSPSILQRVADRVEGSPDESVLANHIRVEFVPPSGVARISVQDTDATRASELAKALSEEIRALDLLSPVGEFRTFGSESDARKTSPDVTLGTGFGLAAGVLSGLLVGGLLTVRRPKVTGRRQASALVDDRNVPVLEVSSLDKPGDLVAELLSQPTIRLVAVDRVAGRILRHREQQSERVAEPSWDDLSAPRRGVVLVAAAGHTTPEELANRCAISRSASSPLVAVVLVSSARG